MTEEPLTFRQAFETDLFEIVGLLADDPLGELREDLRAPLPVAYRAAFRTRPCRKLSCSVPTISPLRSVTTSNWLGSFSIVEMRM
ncbi:hypothetical protein [Nioella ostreopsis]|uniref:hypothetical protein n=1 Tax=Nioella ostreopsis TaxID=2448479 RepID=UPI000FD9A692|nr:hypothetical protein [Nioella ostreopsis]